MISPESIVPAIYTRITKGEVPDAERLTERFLAREIPAFVIANSGISLAEATDSTGVVAALKAAGYEGNIRDSVSFGAEIRVILPPDLSNMLIPHGVEWHFAGVTTLHADKPNCQRGRCYSLNFTEAGIAEFRIHESRIPQEGFEDQWELLDAQNGQLLWHGLVDPELISPEGYITELRAQDLLVFDPSYAHMSRALTKPRLAEATFFEKHSA